MGALGWSSGCRKMAHVIPFPEQYGSHHISHAGCASPQEHKKLPPRIFSIIHPPLAITSKLLLSGEYTHIFRNLVTIARSAVDCVCSKPNDAFLGSSPEHPVWTGAEVSLLKGLSSFRRLCTR